MFGHMKAEPILSLKPAASVEEAIQKLIHATDEAQPVRWLEFPLAVLICVTVTSEPNVGGLIRLGSQARSLALDRF